MPEDRQEKHRQEKHGQEERGQEKHEQEEHDGERTGEQQPPRGAPRCPRCGATDGEVLSLFGSQAMTLQYRCRACGTIYEAIKYDRP